MTTNARDRPDPILPGLMIGRAALHEFYAAAEADAASTIGVILALALGPSPRPLLWARQDAVSRERGTPYPPGLREYGFDPAEILFVQVRDAQAVLQAGLEGARCAALGAVVIELWDDAHALDLTASRRLALAAQASGTPVLMARISAQPCPSAAETRWQVRAAPSRVLAANAPGNPVIILDLLRHRGGVSQGTWHLEWNRDSRSFDDLARPARPVPTPPLHGALVSVSADRQTAPDHGEPRRHAG